jgi:ATP-dependent Clp protease protease subunit
MAESKSPIRTSCEGYCMSMAAYLLSYGNVRQAGAHSTIMFHEVGATAEGKVHEIVNELAEMQRLQNIMNTLIKHRSGMTMADCKKMEAYDHFMSPEEAKSLGLIDVIVGK